jgi:hypothetical protein
MGIRTTDSIKEELSLSKREERDFLKNALLIAQTFDEKYIIGEQARIHREIEELMLKKSPDDIMKNNERINAEVKRLRSKLKMFNYLIIS